MHEFTKSDVWRSCCIQRRTIYVVGRKELTKSARETKLILLLYSTSKRTPECINTVAQQIDRMCAMKPQEPPCPRARHGEYRQRASTRVCSCSVDRRGVMAPRGSAPTKPAVARTPDEVFQVVGINNQPRPPAGESAQPPGICSSTIYVPLVRDDIRVECLRCHAPLSQQE